MLFRSAAQTLFRQNFRAKFEGDPSKSRVYKDISKGVPSAGIEYYLPLFFESTARFADFLPANTIVCAVSGQQGLQEAVDAFWQDARSRYATLRGDRANPVMPPHDLFLSPDELFGSIKPFARVELDAAPLPAEIAAPHAARLALAKAATAASRNPDTVVIAADTVVACGRRILPKAETEAQARQCLALLSGRRHRVYGSIVVQAPRGVIRQRTVVTFVKMKRLTDAELEAYIASGEWQGKAGGYAIQGKAAAFITEINGSYTNVVGLCLPTTVKLLAEFR